MFVVILKSRLGLIIETVPISFPSCVKSNISSLIEALLINARESREFLVILALDINSSIFFVSLFVF